MARGETRKRPSNFDLRLTGGGWRRRPRLEPSEYQKCDTTRSKLSQIVTSDRYLVASTIPGHKIWGSEFQGLMFRPGPGDSFFRAAAIFWWRRRQALLRGPQEALDHAAALGTHTVCSPPAVERTALGSLLWTFLDRIGRGTGELARVLVHWSRTMRRPGVAALEARQRLWVPGQRGSWRVVFAWILLVGADSALAQQEPRALDLSGRVELARLVDLASARLGLNIEYDEAALRGAVTLRLGGELTDDELWELVSRLLASNGLTTVRMPGSQTLSVVKLPDAPALARIEVGGLRRAERFGEPAGPGRPRDAREPDEPEAPAGPGRVAAQPAAEARDEPLAAVAAGFEAVVIRAEHLTPTELIEAVKPALSKAGQMTALGKTELVLLQDLRPRIGQVLELVEQVDAPAGRVVIEEISPRQVSAGRLAAAVAQAVATRDAVTGRPLRGKLSAVEGKEALLLVAPPAEAEQWRDLIERLDQAEPVERRSYRAEYFDIAQVASLIEQVMGVGEESSAEQEVRLVVDELTDTLLVTATPSQHDELAAIVERLNSADGAARRSMRTYAVRNRPVDEVVSLLNQLLGLGNSGSGMGGSGDAGSPRLGPMGARLEPGAQADPAVAAGGATPELPAVAAGAEASGTSVAGPSSRLLLTADTQTSSIIAIGEPRLLEQVEALLKTLDVRQAQVVLDVTIVSLTEGQSRDLGVELEKIDMYGNTLVRLSSLFGLSSRAGDSRAVGDGIGFTGVVLSPGDFSVVIRALETVNQGRNLSLPRILVDNNQQATLDAVREEPFLSVNASDTIATTSFGGSASAGTQISLRPQIAEGDHLLLEYNISLSSFVGESSDPSLPPPRQDSSISSIATIPDGHAIVLGGLETQSEGDAESRLPLLGTIPLVGELFKNRSRSNSRTRFYVFIRASVMRGEGFEYLKHITARSMEELGMDDGWPVVEPRIIR